MEGRRDGRRDGRTEGRRDGGTEMGGRDGGTEGRRDGDGGGGRKGGESGGWGGSAGGYHNFDTPWGTAAGRGPLMSALPPPSGKASMGAWQPVGWQPCRFIGEFIECLLPLGPAARLLGTGVRDTGRSIRLESEQNRK